MRVEKCIDCKKDVDLPDWPEKTNPMDSYFLPTCKECASKRHDRVFHLWNEDINGEDNEKKKNI